MIRAAALGAPRALGDALLDQRLVAGIGNIWKAEGALADARLAVACRRRRHGRRAPRAARWRRRGDDARASPAPARCGTSTAASGDPARAAAPRSVRAARASANRIAYWCPGCQGEGRSRPARNGGVAVRRSAPLRLAAPLLPRRLRGARRASSTSGADLPFAFEEHGSPGARRSTSTARSCAASSRRAPTGSTQRDDVRAAIDDLQREPAARDLRARPRRRRRPTEAARALPQRARCRCSCATAEGCGGFDWDDDAFDRAYAELEAIALRRRRTPTRAVAPLVGISCGAQIELGGGIRVRAAAAGELAAMWPEATGCCRATSAASPTGSACSSSSARSTPARRAARRAGRARRRRHRAPARDRRRPSPPGRCSSSGSTGGRSGSGPVLPIAATQPPGEPTRLDPFRGAARRDAARAPRRSPTTTRSSARRSTAGSSSLFQDEPFRAEQLREALDCAARRQRRALGRGDARRCAARRDADATAASSSPDCARSREAARRRAAGRRCAARSSRSLAPRRPRRSSSRRSTSRSSACARGRRATSRCAPRRADRQAIGTISTQFSRFAPYR